MTEKNRKIKQKKEVEQMLRSLYSGVSGMKNLQNKMDVVANNIANVNTTGFKSSRVLFQDVMSQTTAKAAAPGNGLGGTNARQIGLGVQTGAIDVNMAVGAPQTTGRSMDFYLSGPGYFMVRGAGNDANATVYYTRDGAFVRDSDGNVVNSNGMKLLADMLDSPVEFTDDFDAEQAFTVDNLEGLKPVNIPASLPGDETALYSAMTIDQNGLITAKYGNKVYVMGKLKVAAFNNPEGLEKVGGNNYIPTNNSGDVMVTNIGDRGTGQLNAGFLEMSNVDLATEFTDMIITNRAYQANSRSITTSDEMLQELINLKR